MSVPGFHRKLFGDAADHVRIGGSMKRSTLTLLVPGTARLLAGIAVLPVLAIAGTTISPPAYQWHTFFGGDGSAAANYPATAVDASGNLSLFEVY